MTGVNWDAKLVLPPKNRDFLGWNNEFPGWLTCQWLEWVKGYVSGNLQVPVDIWQELPASPTGAGWLTLNQLKDYRGLKIEKLEAVIKELKHYCPPAKKLVEELIEELGKEIEDESD